jgi:D-alanine-D-alanine ligase-like ATP-grasp enzyme/ribosomal protein S18 acetylase RimI-like enzyme
MSEHHSVLILYNLPEAGRPGRPAESEAGVMTEVKAVGAALTKLGWPHRRAGIRRLRDLPSVLRVNPHQVVFNLVEGFPERPEDAMLVPAVCHSFGKAVTGSDTACLTLTLDKAKTKAVLRTSGVSVPGGIVVPVGSPLDPGMLDQDLTYIVKPLSADASEGIGPDSIGKPGSPALAAAVSRIHQQFRHPALVEQFVGNREFNVSVLARGDHVEVLPVAEIVFDGYGPDRPLIVDYAAKWHSNSFEYTHTRRVVPAAVDQTVADSLRRAALEACSACGCSDYARVDFRMDPDNRHHVLEVNPNPDISPEAGFPAALAAAGIAYEEFVMAVVSNAARRHAGREVRLDAATAQAADAATSEGPAIRRTAPADRDAILSFTEATGFFRTGELDVAAEVLDDALAGGPDGHYQSFVAVSDGKPVGWVCYGPTPCTEGTYDIYWIVVDPQVQSRGIGRRLMSHAEGLIKEGGGRLVVLETSGSERYARTCGFYVKAGYRQAARAADFYGPGDDKLVYLKRVDEAKTEGGP